MKKNHNLITPPLWQKTVNEIKHRQGKVRVFLLGASDTGKTTFADYLINELVRNKQRTALLDADPGQSTIGPPATIGLAVCSRLPLDSEKVTPRLWRFVGSTSPVNNLSAILEGVERMVDKAAELKIEKMVVDTTGLVSGPLGQKLKLQKIELVKPTHLIAFQKEDELTSILSHFQNRKGLNLSSLPVPEVVKSRSREERIRNREEKFRAYFQDGTIKRFSLKNVSLRGTIPDFSGQVNLEGLLIGLADGENNLLVLGIMKAINLGDNTLTVFIPAIKPSLIKTVRFGSLRLSPEGKEIT